LIKQQAGIRLPIRTVGEYLRRWGYTPQKPVRKAYKQDPKAVAEWLEKTYPTIEKRAAQEGGVKCAPKTRPLGLLNRCGN
jgi:hypothetical protein